MENKRLFISFSGGETSALMTKMLLESKSIRERYAEIVIGFSNTGQENEQTLEFVDRCDKAFGFGVTWIEALPTRGRGQIVHRIVSFETASRKGEPFKQMISLYGIPNVDFPMCTRELKTRPMTDFIRRGLGWEPGTYDTAIGIRADESHRRGANAVKNRLVYPLMDWWPMGKPDVNTFWRDQPFRLELAGYQGNCKTCWKKSTRKLLTIMEEAPRAFDFFEEMEEKYAGVGPEFKQLHKYPEGYRRTFLRQHVTIKELREMHKAGGWEMAENDAVVYAGKQLSLDIDDGCVESCEVNF